MQLNMNDPNPGIWFPWPWNKEGKPEGGGVTLRTLTMRVRREIDVKTVKTDVTMKEGYVYERRIIDHELRIRLVNDYCIIGWTGLRNADGNEIACDIDTKERVYLDYPSVAQFLMNCIDKVDELAAKRLEDAGKNS
jgi:hypothetical protein